MFTSQTQGSHSDYINQEAHERSYELLLQTYHQAQKLKKKIISSGKQAIDEEFKKKHRQSQLQKQIYMNVLTNQHKITRLKARFELCQKIYQEIETRLMSFSTAQETSNEYQFFLISSIVEGLIRMFQEKVDVRCLERDRTLIQNLLPQIREIYREFMVSNIGFEYPLDLNISSNFILQERDPKLGPLQKNRQDSLSIGGVILADKSGNITFKATLDCRLNVLKENCLPIIREMIWNKSNQSLETNQ